MNLTDKMQALAEAAGDWVYLTAKGDGKWSATCGEVEFDGSTAEAAVDSVLAELRRNLEEELVSHKASALRAQNTLERMPHG